MQLAQVNALDQITKHIRRGINRRSNHRARKVGSASE
jgi:hypothetical protein